MYCYLNSRGVSCVAVSWLCSLLAILSKLILYVRTILTSVSGEHLEIVFNMADFCKFSIIAIQDRIAEFSYPDQH
jgi:hypothetical protein